MNFEIGQQVIHTVTHIFNTRGVTTRKQFTVDAVVSGFSKNGKLVVIDFKDRFGQRATKKCHPITLSVKNVQ